MRTINQTNNFQNSENELAQNFTNAKIQNQTNINVISNTSIAKKINKDVSFKAFSLANYGQIWTLLRNVALILLVLIFTSVPFISVSINKEEEAISIFLYSIGTLFTYLILYIIVFVKVKVDDGFIQFKGKKYNFSNIRKMKFYKTLFNGKYIKIYLENDTYPNATLYLDDDQMDVVEEFYLDYLKSTQSRKKEDAYSSFFNLA